VSGVDGPCPVDVVTLGCYQHLDRNIYRVKGTVRGA
jgi:hypothetical protein